MQRYDRSIIKGVKLLETILAIFIIVTVLISGFSLIRQLYKLITLDYIQSYDFVQALLAHVLLLVIGLELSMMLIRHTPGSVIEVMLYAIARKMLIYSRQTYEIAIGVIALAGLFAIRKFLYVHRIEQSEEQVLSPQTSIKTVNKLTGLLIPEELGDNLGNLILNLSEGRPLSMGEIFTISNAEITVVKVKNGKPELLQISEISSK